MNEQNTTQDVLANAACISRSTLSLLERGETGTLATVIQVLRVLDQLNVLEVFSIQQDISPLTLAKMEKDKGDSMTPVEMLCFIGTRGMGALEFETEQLPNI